MSLYGPEDDPDDVLPVVSLALGVLGAGLLLGSCAAAGAIVVLDKLVKREEGACSR